MKKLLLTSTGFKNFKIAEKFLELVDKPVSEIKVLFIPTASQTTEEIIYVEESRRELIDLGILRENVFDFNLDRKLSEKELNNFNAVYVCGGNTFYLMSEMKKSGFDEVLKSLIKKGVVYVGVSAGSIIVGPDIKLAVPFDENIVGLKDLSGLDLIQIVPSPHYVKDEDQILKDIQQKVGYKILPLTDNQALLIVGDKEEIIE